MMKKVKCMLLIDDDETTNIINEMLIMDMEVTEKLLKARNGKEGISLLREHVQLTSERQQQKCLPELILLDINMPVMDGFAFLEAFNQLDLPGKSSVNIVMLTTSLNPLDVERTRNAGLADYVSKPLTEQKLKEILENFPK